jgi:hypothetical protein
MLGYVVEVFIGRHSEWLGALDGKPRAVSSCVGATVFSTRDEALAAVQACLKNRDCEPSGFAVWRGIAPAPFARALSERYERRRSKSVVETLGPLLSPASRSCLSHARNARTR